MLAADPEHVVWVRLANLVHSHHVRDIANGLGFYELVVYDLLSDRQRPKVETYGDQLFIIARLPYFSASGRFETEQIAVVLSRNIVLTFQHGVRRLLFLQGPFRVVLHHGTRTPPCTDDFVCRAVDCGSSRKARRSG